MRRRVVDGIRWTLFGGTGRPVVLLHGVGGSAAEWESTAEWLTGSRRVVAPDLPGHAGSRRAGDLSPEAMAEDVAAGLRALRAAPAAVAGHSMGGVVAFLLAARHPELVERLVVVDASPSGGREGLDRAAAWVRSWPVPFRDQEAARTVLPAMWLKNLERRDGGWWPAFEVEAMLAQAPRDRWAEWRSIACPTVLITAEHSFVSAEDAEAMAVPRIAVSGSRHDIHMSAPDGWRRALEEALGG